MRDADFKWFIDNYDKLFEKYGHKFIAIKDKTVLGVYDNVVEAIGTTTKTYEIGSFITQECSGDHSAYRASIVTPWIIENE